MKKKKTQVWMWLLVLLCGGMPAMAQSYKEMWNKVEAFRKKDQPRSVAEVAAAIYRKAEAERNVPQMMKAYLTEMDARARIAPDSLAVDVEALQRWAATEHDSADAAVLYSIAGELLLQQKPEAALECLLRSLRPRQALEQRSAEEYVPMTAQGETSIRYEANRMFPLLAHRAIRLLQENRYRFDGQREMNDTIASLYHSLAAYFEHRGEKEALLLLRIEEMKQNLDARSIGERIALCRQWIARYGEVESCAGVYGQLASLLRSEGENKAAYDTLRAGMVRYPEYADLNRLKNTLAEWTNPQLDFRIGILYPGKEERMWVMHRHLSGFDLKIYRTGVDDAAKLADYEATKKEPFWKDKWKLYRTEHYALHSEVYEARDTTLTLRLPEEGYYLLEAVPQKGFRGKFESERRLVYVSALGIIKSPRVYDGTRLMVVDRMTGALVKGAKVRFFTRENGTYIPREEYLTDDWGVMACAGSKGETPNRRMYVRASTPEHPCMPLLSVYDYNITAFAERKEERMELFTDRTLYRPGQTVYASGILFTQETDSAYVNERREVTVELCDVNGKTVGAETLQTNEFGSFHTQFALPAVCLPGSFSLRATAGKNNLCTLSLQVEEYKRPQFEVEWDALTTTYTYGDTVWIAGEARLFTGVPLQEAEVRYRVEKPAFIFRVSTPIPEESLRGIVKTDSTGRFKFPLVIDKVEDLRSSYRQYVVYTYTVEVVSQAGDTQRRQGRLRVMDKPYVLTCETKGSDWIKEHPCPVTWGVWNGNGEKLQRKLTWEVVPLQWRENGKPIPGRTVYAAEAESNKAFVPEAVYHLASGNYRIRISLRENGTVYADSTDIALFSLQDRRLPAGKDLFVYADDLKPGETMSAVYVGTSRKDVHLFGNMYVVGEQATVRYLPLSDTLCVVPFSQIGEKEIDALCLAYVKEGRLCQQYVSIDKLVPDKQLAVRWQTFRDKLQAGGKEEWRLRIADAQGRPVRSELLATLYDASLDKLARRGGWNIYFNWRKGFPYMHCDLLEGDGGYFRICFPFDRLSVQQSDYSRLLIPGGLFHGRGYYVRAKNYDYKTPAIVEEVVEEEQIFQFVTGRTPARKTLQFAGAVAADGATAKNELQVVFEEEIVPASSQDVVLAPRQDFAETAFFYPQLRTNEQGEVDLVFTLPESLTTWRFMGLAHTRTMDYAAIDTTAVARKEFMLQAHLPRFVRVGDWTTLGATLSNLTGKEIKGTVRMELFDPMTEKVFHTATGKFRLAAGRTAPVSFGYRIPDTRKVMACRMIAEGGAFSDGEQHYLPVLDNKDRFTESVAVSMHQAGEKTVDLGSLFNHQNPAAADRHLTVEFTGNPSWLAIMALPSIGSPSEQDALSWAAAYYSASLASWIVEQHPRIRTLFEAWKAQGGKETFLSELEKNRELKEMVIECSPFLLEAESEVEQRRRLGALFDLNTLQNRKTLYVERLKGLQTPEGGWSWYEGMEPNRYVTMSVVEMLLRLRSLTLGAETPTAALLKKGVDYLDKQAVEEYRRLREQPERQLKLSEKQPEHSKRLTEFASHYLYLCMLADHHPVGEAKRAYDYFFARLKVQSPYMTVYGKAVAAMVLAKGGEQAVSREFVKSLLEYSVYTPEMGRYYDTSIVESTWADYRIPTQTVVIEALHRLDGDKAVLAQMQQWLLKQKQVQSWNTPVNTVNSVYALLLENDSLLAERPMPQLWLDNRPVAMDNASLGLNTVKETMALPDGTNPPRTFTVRKESDGVAWGAVYAQYMEEVDKVSNQSEGLSVVRKVYVERMADGESRWVELEKGTVLRVGDKIKSSLQLTTDRDMDFVQIKENRAACMEPASVLSGYRWGQGVGYYQVIKDAWLEYYIDKLRKGTCTIESLYDVTLEGVYEMGCVKVQSAYAPEFNAHTEGGILRVAK